MQITTKTLPKSRVELKISVDAAELAPFRAQALTNLNKELKIAGYRPGHIPEDVVVEKVGASVIERETIDLALQHFYADAVREKNLPIVARPEVTVESVAPLTFTAIVAVLPEVKLGDYKKIKLKKEEVKISEKEITELVADLKKRHATTQTITRAAEKGDRVELDFAGFTLDGVALEGTVSRNHPFVLGEGNFIPGFEDGVFGMKVGEEKEHAVKFPADYHAKNLANQDVKFKFQLQKLEEVVLPEADDALATKIKNTPAKWAEIETEMRKYLTTKKTEAAQAKLENEMITEFLKIAQIDVPDALIAEEVEHMLADLKRRLTEGGLAFDKYLAQSKKTEAELRTEMSGEAENRVKVRLIVTELLKVEKVEIPDAEIKTAVAKIKQNYPASEHAKIETAYVSGGEPEQRLRRELQILKLMEKLTSELSA